jgi:Fe2+ transport system protein FeoA
MSDQGRLSLPTPSAQVLADFAPGEEAVMTGFVGGRNLQGRLLAMGLFPGQRLTICQNHGNSLVISLNGHKVVLGRGVGQKILAVPAGPCTRRQEHCCCPPTDRGPTS